MAVLWNRTCHYIFVLWFLSSFSSFFSSPNLSSGRLDVYHTSTPWCGPSANLVCRSEMCCTRPAVNAGPKNRPKFPICAPSHNFVKLYLRNWRMYRQSDKNLLNSSISPTCPYNMVNDGSLAAEIISLFRDTPANFNRFRVLASLLQRRRSTEVTGNQTFCTTFGHLLGWYTVYTRSGYCLYCQVFHRHHAVYIGHFFIHS